MTAADLSTLFDHHPLDPAQSAKVAALRHSAKAFAAAIVVNAPECADATFALRQVRSALHFAIGAIAIPK